jgi:serine/threonine protein kinase
VKPLRGGGFGEISIVQDNTSDEQFILKKVLKADEKDDYDWTVEARLGLQLTSPYIVKLHRVFADEFWGYLVMEYCPKGDLGRLISEKKKRSERFSETVRRSFTIFSFSSLLNLLLRKCGI